MDGFKAGLRELQEIDNSRCFGFRRFRSKIIRLTLFACENPSLFNERPADQSKNVRCLD